MVIEIHPHFQVAKFWFTLDQFQKDLTNKNIVFKKLIFLSKGKSFHNLNSCKLFTDWWYLCRTEGAVWRLLTEAPGILFWQIASKLWRDPGTLPDQQTPPLPGGECTFGIETETSKLQISPLLLLGQLKDCIYRLVSGLRPRFLRGAWVLGSGWPAPGALLPAHLLQGQVRHKPGSFAG